MSSTTQPQSQPQPQTQTPSQPPSQPQQNASQGAPALNQNVTFAPTFSFCDPQQIAQNIPCYSTGNISPDTFKNIPKYTPTQIPNTVDQCDFFCENKANLIPSSTEQPKKLNLCLYALKIMGHHMYEGQFIVPYKVILQMKEFIGDVPGLDIILKLKQIPIDTQICLKGLCGVCEIKDCSTCCSLKKIICSKLWTYWICNNLKVGEATQTCIFDEMRIENKFTQHVAEYFGLGPLNVLAQLTEHYHNYINLLQNMDQCIMNTLSNNTAPIDSTFVQEVNKRAEEIEKQISTSPVESYYLPYPEESSTKQRENQQTQQRESSYVQNKESFQKKEKFVDSLVESYYLPYPEESSTKQRENQQTSQKKENQQTKQREPSYVQNKESFQTGRVSQKQYNKEHKQQKIKPQFVQNKESFQTSRFSQKQDNKEHKQQTDRLDQKQDNEDNEDNEEYKQTQKQQTPKKGKPQFIQNKDLFKPANRFDQQSQQKSIYDDIFAPKSSQATNSQTLHASTNGQALYTNANANGQTFHASANGQTRLHASANGHIRPV